MAAGHARPGLAVVLVGEDPASQVYVRRKIKSCEKVGITSTEHRLPADTSQKDLLALIDRTEAEVNGWIDNLTAERHDRRTAAARVVTAIAKR